MLPTNTRIKLKEKGRQFWKKTGENTLKKKLEGMSRIRERRTYAGPMNMDRNKRKKEESTKKWRQGRVRKMQKKFVKKVRDCMKRTRVFAKRWRKRKRVNL